MFILKYKIIKYASHKLYSYNFIHNFLVYCKACKVTLNIDVNKLKFEVRLQQCCINKTTINENLKPKLYILFDSLEIFLDIYEIALLVSNN